MTPLRQRFIEDLQLRNRSPRTIEVYVMHLKAYAAWFNRPGRRVTLCPASIGSNTIPVKTLRHARLGRSVTRG